MASAPPDEKTLLGSAEGVVELTVAPTNVTNFGRPPINQNERGNPELKTHLWVVLPDRVPTILENHPHSKNLASKRITHTNLTGGADAHCGGEFWVKDARTLYLSGASGRYGPRSAQELEKAAQAFHAAGYKVGSLGWDGDYPRKIMREDDVQWK
jgi:hypothetical protein